MRQKDLLYVAVILALAVFVFLILNAVEGFVIDKTLNSIIESHVDVFL